MKPKYRMDKESRGGVGLEEKFEAVAFQLRMKEFLTMVRRRCNTPLQWDRSYASSADKGNGKEGIKGLRMLHCFEAASMAWFGGVAARTTTV